MHSTCEFGREHLSRGAGFLSPITLSHVLAAIILTACSSSENVAESPAVGGESGTHTTGGAAQGGFPSFGGSTQSSTIAATGGALSGTGGESSTPTTAQGGSKATGGAVATGGKAATGGAAATGGKVTTGGAAASGGVAATGGAVNGGSSAGGNASGGNLASGGVASSGGSNAAGGGKASGGTGPSVGGGSSHTGGAATGGRTSTVVPKKFVGNITTGYSAAADYNGMTYAHYWDQITPENAGKWGSVQKSITSAPDWKTMDAIYKYTEDNGILFKQHTFVWGPQQPSGTITLADVDGWIKGFCERYENVKLIDVVNEPPPHQTPSYTSALGAGESGTYGWITKAFKLARQYCPNAILILNDYNDIEYSDQENHIIDIVNQVVKAGGPIDAVGAQAHDANKLSASQLQANLNTMHDKTGLPVYITEYDVSNTSDDGQLSTYKAQFPVFYNTDFVHGITIWGWIYGQTWQQAANSGLVKDKTPRSAMTWLMQQLGRPIPPN